MRPQKSFRSIPEFVPMVISLDEDLTGLYNHKNGDSLEYPQYIFSKIYSQIRSRNNKRGIIHTMNKYESKYRAKIASVYMDYCIDEESIDTLVYFGGDPGHYTDDIDICNNDIDMCRTIIRRLFHGARCLPDRVLSDVFIHKNRFLVSPTSKYQCKQSRRSIKYSRMENSKLDFWLYTFPDTFTEQCTNDMEYYSTEEDMLKYPSNNMYYIFNNGKVVRHIYIYGDGLSQDDWVKFELAFGKYCRTKDVIVSVLCRGMNSPKIPRISEKYPVRNLMHRVGYDLVRNIIQYI